MARDWQVGEGDCRGSGVNLFVDGGCKSGMGQRLQGLCIPLIDDSTSPVWLKNGSLVAGDQTSPRGAISCKPDENGGSLGAGKKVGDKLGADL